MEQTYPTGPIGWMVLPLRRYAVFRGRSGRREFWWYCLFLALGYATITALAFPLAATTMTSDDIGLWIAGGWFLFFVMNFIPGLALTTRRLHDLGLSGALLIAIFAALLFLNLIGWLAYLVVMSLPGKAGPTRWGPPLAEADIADVFV